MTGQAADIAEEFAERLRQAAGVETAYSLAKRCGLPARLVLTYLRGDSSPGIKNLALLASALGVSVEWLVLGAGPMRPEWPRQGEPAAACADDQGVRHDADDAGVSRQEFEALVRQVRRLEDGVQPAKSRRGAKRATGKAGGS